MSTFDSRAKEWDKLQRRVQNAKDIAQAIFRHIEPNENMQIIDFGVGTGLLGFEIAKKVKKVYGVDTSKEMLETLKTKNSDTLYIEPILADITKEPLELVVDGVVSSMTLHHIENLEKFFNTIKDNLRTGGFIAIADLVSEDGTFHSDNTGVHHFGFAKEELLAIVKKAGFQNADFTVIHEIKKPHKNFPVFLLTAFKGD